MIVVVIAVFVGRVRGFSYLLHKVAEPPTVIHKLLYGSIITTIVGIETLSHCILCMVQTLNLLVEI